MCYFTQITLDNRLSFCYIINTHGDTNHQPKGNTMKTIALETSADITFHINSLRESCKFNSIIQNPTEVMMHINTAEKCASEWDIDGCSLHLTWAYEIYNKINLECIEEMTQ